jgi:hypothetical protein
MDASGEEMTTTNREKLLALGPCRDGLARAAECATLREWWETSTVLGDMRWLYAKAHSNGTMTRRRLVAISLRAVETVMHLLPDESIADLGLLAEWCAGRDDLDLVAVRQRLRADAAYAADAYAYAAYADAYADAYAAAADAYADAAMCDVLRDAVTIDELCACLSLDPDQGCAE